jgi:hypothetical protein
MSSYLTPVEYRDMAGVTAAEWPTSNLNLLIDQATSELDLRTGRTWQGLVSVVNEYLDGDNSNMLYLNVTDLVSVDALAVDPTNAGDYTALTVGTNNNSTEGVRWYSCGLVVIQTGAEFLFFPKGRKTVRISYTHGNASPINVVKRLCFLMVQNSIAFDAARKEEIDFLLKQLTSHRMF